MSILPFLLMGLLNGIVVGLVAALVKRGIASGDRSMRFRDTAFFGMIGAIGGTVIASVLNSQDGFLASGPSSLLFSVIGAAVVIGGVVSYRQLTRERVASLDSHHHV